MTGILDIIILVIFVWALICGARQGIVKQLCALAALFGIFLALRYCNKVDIPWIASLPALLKFTILFFVIVLLLLLVGKFTKSLVHAAGLGAADRVGGAFLSLIKYAIVLSLALNIFVSFNKSVNIVNEKVIAQSRLAGPVMSLTDLLMPYFHDLNDIIQDGAEMFTGE